MRRDGVGGGGAGSPNLPTSLLPHRDRHRFWPIASEPDPLRPLPPSLPPLCPAHPGGLFSSPARANPRLGVSRASRFLVLRKKELGVGVGQRRQRTGGSEQPGEPADCREERSREKDARERRTVWRRLKPPVCRAEDVGKKTLEGIKEEEKEEEVGWDGIIQEVWRPVGQVGGDASEQVTHQHWACLNLPPSSLLPGSDRGHGRTNHVTGARCMTSADLRAKDQRGGGRARGRRQQAPIFSWVYGPEVAMSPGEDGLIGIPFPEHSNELLSHLNDQRRTGLLCDLTLTSRGARYPTHRSVMAAVSLYFRGLFGAEEGGGEGGGGGFSVCQLDCVAPDALDALLEFAYTATLTIHSSGMRDVLRGAQLLGIQCVADACRDILGETAEGDVAAEEPRTQHTAAERMTEGESGVERGSRRKTDKKKMKKAGLHHINSSVLNPPSASPVSHPSPASDSFRSLPSTQPPSPEQEELHLKSRQNGDPRAIRKPEREATLNGGPLHWLHERPHIAHAPPAPPPNNKLSEDEEGFGDDGMLMESPPIPTSVADQGAAASAAVGGRKRKSQTPQQCPVCQKIIHGAGKLPRHMRTHTGEKPFQCSACGVRFTRNDKLKIHMRKHTGERPYPCPHCPARFLHSYDLKNHLSLHSGARPFECPLCHKAFAREDHLQRHRKGHSCLELRTRRPRRGAELVEDGRGDGGVREQSNPLEALSSLQAHSSAFLPRAVLDGGRGPNVGPPLMFPGDVGRERERSLTFQALAQLGPHRLAGYPELFLRGLELRAGREAEGEDPGGTRSPVVQRDRWADEVEEEIGEEEAEEEE